jgi:hypothetical protein
MRMELREERLSWPARIGRGSYREFNGLGLGIGTACAGIVSAAGALSLCEGSGCQVGLIAHHPPPPLTMVGWQSSILS